jgi:hypothetical protein
LALWHNVIVLVELLDEEVQAVGILDEQQDKGVGHQEGRAVEDGLPGIQLGN